MGGARLGRRRASVVSSQLERASRCSESLDCRYSAICIPPPPPSLLPLRLSSRIAWWPLRAWQRDSMATCVAHRRGGGAYMHVCAHRHARVRARWGRPLGHGAPERGARARPARSARPKKEEGGTGAVLGTHLAQIILREVEPLDVGPARALQQVLDRTRCARPELVEREVNLRERVLRLEGDADRRDLEVDQPVVLELRVGVAAAAQHGAPRGQRLRHAPELPHPRLARGLRIQPRCGHARQQLFQRTRSGCVCVCKQSGVTGLACVRFACGGECAWRVSGSIDCRLCRAQRARVITLCVA